MQRAAPWLEVAFSIFDNVSHFRFQELKFTHNYYRV